MGSFVRARIPHYWRVENQDGRAVVHVREPEPSTGVHACTSTGISHDRMKVAVPFPVDLDLTALTARRRAVGQE